MTRGSASIRATPFHARTAAANRDNAWIVRNGTTLASYYANAEDEALAARLRVALADISWRWCVTFEDAAAEALLSRLLTREVAALSPGQAFKALWLADGGGVRGACTLARMAADSFQLIAAAPDAEWIAALAASFGVASRDVSAETGGLALVGPYAGRVLEAAGLDGDLAPLAFRQSSWRGIDVTLSRFGELGGYEIRCAPDDGLIVWDRLMRAGEDFAIAPAGVAALDILDIEAGQAQPWLDFAPAREPDAAAPGPRALGLESLIDKDHTSFSGHAGFLSQSGGRTLVGLEIASDTPAPFTPVMLGGKSVGQTLRSVYSPALRRAIALASVDGLVPGAQVSVTLPASFDAPALRPAQASVVGLPFLPRPKSMGA
jgi:aminomethyltransferase